MEPYDLMKTSEVAAAFRVAPGTVGRWADEGKLDSVRTPGGQRRFYRSQVEQLMRQEADVPL
ncbi:hypothetical protein GCM10009527_097980 [Actinomadura nitritigenes]|uniref:Helix-turn-helix domain-containing protein n=2 Tax=Actinomadura nitritigenes TaxID=134602 RepID=A0ABS3QWC5_9ACTN|nr:helix-turn-helix domain-containing protein [Actinomadura nitritigenes]